MTSFLLFMYRFCLTSVVSFSRSRPWLFQLGSTNSRQSAYSAHIQTTLVMDLWELPHIQIRSHIVLFLVIVRWKDQTLMWCFSFNFFFVSYSSHKELNFFFVSTFYIPLILMLILCVINYKRVIQSVFCYLYVTYYLLASSFTHENTIYIFF